MRNPRNVPMWSIRSIIPGARVGTITTIPTLGAATGPPIPATRSIEMSPMTRTVCFHVGQNAIVSFVLLVSLVGCSKKETPTVSSPAKPAAGVSVEAQPDQAPPPPATSSPGSGEATTSNDSTPPDAPPPDRGAADAKQQELIDEVFAAYRNHYADKLRYARDIDELVKLGYLKKKPVPP